MRPGGQAVAAAPAADGDHAPSRAAAARAKAQALSERYGRLGGEELLRFMIREEFPGRIALVSSFGTEAAVLLHMVSRVDPATPVIFVDTGRLFEETLAYRDALAERFGLTDLRTVGPAAERIDALDPDKRLWQANPDLCCYLRKVEPLNRALDGFDAWITGRKGYQGATRVGLPPIEAFDGRVKVNPLARWSRDEITAHFAAHDLPRHPLEAEGFLSIGCLPCTDRVAPGEDPRAGRWRGSEKTECGIHWPSAGRAAAEAPQG